ncbi:Transcription elongation factor B polypeptide 2 [Chelonia mydas]|uniref:Transcription elongation factor B polypeptide 2 n=1 Tax=Chelonia mydas TaxID=8469 RepID=M7AJ06_CHEMY|nr:Transcription elongation factor B polypeptide 2 [Chelonia mydas]
MTAWTSEDRNCKRRGLCADPGLRRSRSLSHATSVLHPRKCSPRCHLALFTTLKRTPAFVFLLTAFSGLSAVSTAEELKEDQLLDDSKTLGDCGFTSQTARPQAPATVGLAFRAGDDSFEALRIDPFSSPPELPDVMKPQDSSSSANEQAVQ